MSAGSIPVPQIIPLRITSFNKSKSGKSSKFHINTNTFIAIKCKYTNQHSIYFTVDESTPAVDVIEDRYSTKSGPPYKTRTANGSTIKFKKPFSLSNGSRIIKAIAVSNISGKESNIVSKKFQVEYVEPNSEDEQEYDPESINLHDKNNSIDSGNNDQQDVSFGQFGPQYSNGVPGQGNVYQGMPFVNGGFYGQQNPGQGQFYPGAPNQAQFYPGQNYQAPVYANPNNLDFGGLSMVQGSNGLNYSSNGYGNGQFNNVPNGQHEVQYLNQKGQKLFDSDGNLIRTSNVRNLKGKGTQTTGLFYPGGRRITRDEEKALEEEFYKIKNKSDNSKVLSAVSPGKGYWRKQIEHLTNHINKYGSSNMEFKSLIADQMIGKITNCTIDEQSDEVKFSFTFKLHGLNEKIDKHEANNYKIGPTPAFGSRLERGLTFEDKYKSKPRTKKSLKFQSNSEISESDQDFSFVNKEPEYKIKRGRSPVNIMKPVDRLLLKEVSGNARLSEVEELLKEGADPNCVDVSSKLPVLIIGIQNKNCSIDVIVKLIEIGANLNTKHTSAKNTPLHYAVIQENLFAIKALLENGAKSDIKNSRNESPYDIAIKKNNKSITSCFVANLSKSVLKRRF